MANLQEQSQQKADELKKLLEEYKANRMVLICAHVSDDIEINYIFKPHVAYVLCDRCVKHTAEVGKILRLELESNGAN